MAGLVYGFGAFLQNQTEGQVGCTVYPSLPPSGMLFFVDGTLQVHCMPSIVTFTSSTDVTMTGAATVGNGAPPNHTMVSGTFTAHIYKNATGSWLNVSVVNALGALIWATGATNPPTVAVPEKLAFLLIQQPTA